jgi:tetratricopeptide (TPR) repeat protein
LTLAEAAGPSPELARGYASVGVILSFVPIHRLASLYCRRALDMARQIDNLPAQAWVFLLTSIYYAGVGRWRNARRLLEKVKEISERLGDHSRWSDAVGNLAMVHYFQGRFDLSAGLFDDLLDSAAQRNDAHNQAWALRGQVYCLLVQAKFDEVLTRLESLQTLLRENDKIVDEALNIDLYGLLALAHLRRDEPKQALAAADTAANLMVKTSPTSYLSLPGYAGVVETFLALWETEKILDFRFRIDDESESGVSSNTDPSNRKSAIQNLKSDTRRACKALRSYARVFPIGQPRASLSRGTFEWLSGRPYRARRLWAKSLEAAKRLDMPHAEGLAHYTLGRYLPSADPHRAEHLRQAREIFACLEATHDLQQAEEALVCTTPN